MLFLSNAPWGSPETSASILETGGLALGSGLRRPENFSTMSAPLGIGLPSRAECCMWICTIAEK